jgi:hypothetical protein
MCSGSPGINGQGQMPSTYYSRSLAVLIDLVSGSGKGNHCHVSVLLVDLECPVSHGLVEDFSSFFIWPLVFVRDLFAPLSPSPSGRQSRGPILRCLRVKEWFRIKGKISGCLNVKYSKRSWTN